MRRIFSRSRHFYFDQICWIYSLVFLHAAVGNFFKTVEQTQILPNLLQFCCLHQFFFCFKLELEEKSLSLANIQAYHKKCGLIFERAR